LQLRLQSKLKFLLFFVLSDKAEFLKYFNDAL